MNARVRAADLKHSMSNHMSHEVRTVNSPVCYKECSSEQNSTPCFLTVICSVCVFRRFCRDLCRGIEL